MLNIHKFLYEYNFSGLMRNYITCWSSFNQIQGTKFYFVFVSVLNFINFHTNNQNKVQIYYNTPFIIIVE